MADGWISTLFAYLGFGQHYTTPPTADADGLIPLQVDQATGALRVTNIVSSLGVPSVYAVAGSWPTVVSSCAALIVATAPGGALAAVAYSTWIVWNASASSVTVAGVTVASKRAVWLSTDSAGVTTSTALGTVP